MTEQSITETPPAFGEWVIVTAAHNHFVDGDKALVTSSTASSDDDPLVELSRCARNGHVDAVRGWVPLASTTRDLSWKPLREERAIQTLLDGIHGWTGSRIGREQAIEILDAVDAVRATEVTV